MLHELPALLLAYRGWHHFLHPLCSNQFPFNLLRTMTQFQSIMWVFLLNLVLSIFSQISNDKPHLWVSALKPQRGIFSIYSQCYAEVVRHLLLWPQLIYFLCGSRSLTSKGTTYPYVSGISMKWPLTLWSNSWRYASFWNISGTTLFLNYLQEKHNKEGFGQFPDDYCFIFVKMLWETQLKLHTRWEVG